MQILAITTQKGGNGKTTTAAILAQAAAVKGLKVLAIDLDPQANLTFELGADATEPGSYDLLHGTPASKVIQKSPQGMDVIAASWGLQIEKSDTGSARRLQRALEPIRKKYDLIIIDTPATAGELQYNALQAATGVIIPLEADVFNMQSLYQTVELAHQLQKSNPQLELKGVILTMYDGRTLLAKKMQLSIINEAGKMGVPYLGAIRKAIAVQEAAALQKSIYEYAPKCKPAGDYMDVFNHLTDYRYVNR